AGVSARCPSRSPARPALERLGGGSPGPLRPPVPRERVAACVALAGGVMTATVAQLRGRLATAVAELIRAGWHVDEIPQALTKEQLLARVLEEERRCRVMQEAS